MSSLLLGLNKSSKEEKMSNARKRVFGEDYENRIERGITESYARRIVEAVYMPQMSLEELQCYERYCEVITDPRIAETILSGIGNSIKDMTAEEIEGLKRQIYTDIDSHVTRIVREYQRFWSKIGTHNEKKLFWENEAPDAWMDKE